MSKRTREGLPDAALDLFIEKGFDETSREIAEQLGVTKAALYCHFASKEDILMVWHMGLYEFGTDARWRVRAATRRVWRCGVSCSRKRSTKHGGDSHRRRCLR